MSGTERVVVLAGGTGGAKLAAGMQDIVGDRLSVIANTADDIEIAGVDVSPDPDLITYWLAGEVDEERGWGIRDDAFVTFERLAQLGAPDWFRLSDRDLATCLYRRTFVAEGGTRTEAQAQICRALGVAAAVLPMCEEPVRTQVRTQEGWRGLQRYLIADRAEPEVFEVRLDNIADAQPTPAVIEAIEGADAIVIGPSNPVISIGPILSVAGLREAIVARDVPVIAVSPYVAGKIVKGPTDRFMAAIGREARATGVASLYAGVITGMICDENDPDDPPSGIETLRTQTLMQGRAGRRELAERALAFVSSLR